MDPIRSTLKWVRLVTLAAAPAAPQAQTAPEPPSLSTAAKVNVTSFHFDGNTVFSSAELSKLLAGYSNREITAEELEDARRKLTQFYIDHGYVNSGATLPDQSVQGGVITFKITEGKLTEIALVGNRYFHSGYLKRQIQGDDRGPLNVLTLRNRLQLLRQNPNLARLNADVRPGTLPGTAILQVDVAENKPYEASINFDNHRPPSVGAERFSLALTHRNLTGWDDTLDLRLGLTHDDLKLSNPLDPHDWSISYTSPEFWRRTRLLAAYSKGDTAVIEEPFAELGITSRSENYSLGLQQPLVKTLDTEVNFTLTAEHRRSSSFLFGEPFSFTSGDVNGVAETTAFRFGADYLHRGANQVLAGRALLSWGNNFPGSTENPARPDGKFVTILAQLQHVTALDDKGRQLILRLDGQWSNNPLLSVEKFVIGGAGSVRGYRENQLVRDKGYVASAEFRQPLLYDKVGRSRLVLAPFVDFGGGTNKDDLNTGETDMLASAGLGLLYFGGSRLSANLYWGHRLKSVSNPRNDLQDRGVHFSISYGM